MSQRTAIYAAGPDNAAELFRALRICLCGVPPPDRLTFSGGDFGAWVREVFNVRIAPPALQVHAETLCGNDEGIIAADRALASHPASLEAGRLLLAARRGARHLPVVKRCAAAIDAGQAPGHFAAVFAMNAADFSIAPLPMLHALLFCEWRGARVQNEAKDVEEFSRMGRVVLPLLPPLLNGYGHGSSTTQFRTLR